MKRIQLRGGYSHCYAIVDDEDYVHLLKYRWYGNSVTVSKLYPQTHIVKGFVDTTIYMHQILLGDPKSGDLEVDHRNRDGLDNRRLNLRWATRSQNRVNTLKQHSKTNRYTSQYKGVSWHKGKPGKWRTRISVNKKIISGGLFYTEWEAAQKYNEMAIEYFGEFAMLNIQKD